MIKGSLDDKFFEMNKEMRYITEISRVIKKLGEDRAGELMWAMSMIHSPSSGIFLMPLSDKQIYANKYYGEEIDWESDIIKGAEEAFVRASLSLEGQLYSQSVILYQSLFEEAKEMPVKDKISFMKGMKAAGDEMRKLEETYRMSIGKGEERASGSVQSGYISRKKK